MPETQETAPDPSAGLPSSMARGGVVEQWAKAAPGAETYIPTNATDLQFSGAKQPAASSSGPAQLSPSGDDSYDKFKKQLIAGESGDNPQPYTALYTPHGVKNFDPRGPTIPGHFGFPQTSGEMGSAGLSHAAGVWQFQPGTWRDAVTGYMQDHPNEPPPDFRNGADQDKVGDYWMNKTYGKNPATGRDLRGDAAAGTIDKSRLAQQWPSLGPRGQLDGVTAGTMPNYNATMAQKQALYDQEHAGLTQILEEIRKEPTGSAERHKMLQQSLEKSAALQDQYKSLLQAPPQHKQTDLLSAFGSLAMLAAAIGGRRSMQPATASLNAAAGVIEGINSNNDQQYDRAFKQWGAQSKMLENVIGMQSDDFKMIMEDQKLSEKERHDKIEEMAQVWNMQHVIDAMHSGDLDKAFKYLEELPKLKLELEEKHARIDEMHATTEERKAHAKYYEQGGVGRGGEEARTIDLSVRGENERRIENGEPPMNAEEESKFRIDKHAERRGSGTMTGMEVGIVNDMVKEAETTIGRPLRGDERNHILQEVRKGGLTGNKQQELDQRYHLYGQSLDVMDEQLKILAKHAGVGVTGLGGYVGRTGERLADVLGGSSSTDYVQFARNLDYLRLNGPILLSGRQGRPLSSEDRRINSIIGGTFLGDTTVNTIRNMLELEKLYRGAQSTIKNELQGTSTLPDRAPIGTSSAPAVVGAPTTVPAPAGNDWWRDSPVAR